MKIVSGTSLLGIALAFAALYVLGPLNKRATTLVIIICFSVAAVIVNGLARLVKKRKENV